MTAYKQTELGLIPSDWEVVALGDIFEFKNGLNKAKEFFGYGSPIVNYMDVYKDVKITENSLSGLVCVDKTEKKNYSAKKGDVFFTRTSETVDEIGLSSVLLDDVTDAVFSGFVLRARQKQNTFISEFMPYLFRNNVIRKQITSTASYTTRALTNGSLLSKIIAPLPPKPEQTAIATALSDTDALLAELEKLLAKKQAIKTATMQQLLTGKTRLPEFAHRADGTPKGSLQTEWGDIPEDWEVVALGDVAFIKTGSKNNQDKKENGQYPFFVRSATVEKINSYSYDCEAILIPGEGGIGSIFHYIDGKFDAHQRVYVIRDFKNVIGKFVFYSLKQNFGKHALENTVKATVDSLRLPTFQKFNFVVPKSTTEQTAIAQILGDMDSEITALQARIEKVREIKQGMMQNLLTGKIRLSF